MLSVMLGGIGNTAQWLSSIPGAGHGPVTVEYGLHGSEAASWQMDPEFRHPLLRANVLTRIWDGGINVWSGSLNEPGSDGTYVAKGLWRQAEKTPTLNGSGDITTWPNDSIAQAFARGDIWWSGTVVGTDAGWAPATTQEMSLAELLDGRTAEDGTRWSVSPTGIVSASVDATVPKWHVPYAVAGRGLTPAEDEFATHLVGRYLDSATSIYKTVTVGSAEAASYFGRKPVLVDLSKLGPTNSTKATAVLNGMFLRAGARIGWAEGLELGHGQITTVTGTPAVLAQVQAGQMIRLAGVVDQSRANRLPSYTDILIAHSSYTDGAGVIRLTPFGYASRSLGGVFEDVLEMAAAA